MKKQMLKIINLLIVITLLIMAFMPKVNAELDLSKTEGSLKLQNMRWEIKGN